MAAISAFDAETRRRVKRLVDARAREKIARPPIERTRLLDPPTDDREVLGFGDRIREVGWPQGSLSMESRGERALSSAGSHPDRRRQPVEPDAHDAGALAAALDLRITITA
jgi:hypothetical protein